LVSLTLAAALVALLVTGQSLLSGTEILIAWAILGVVVIVFFAVIFRRLLRLEVKKQDASVNIDLGGPS
jgi:hypothetical protein